MNARAKRKHAGVVMGLAIAAGVLAAGNVSASGGAESPSETARMTSIIHWLGHDSFRIDGDNMVIY
ncbi:MAG: hypothetical protein Q7U40_11110, partial [Desulfatirhabdiaceae bacterium]|nr:hypothetical protein [Desulfatirhabdiaceae bacterium]